MINRKPGMEPDEFKKYWSEVHPKISTKVPGVRKYVQNHSKSDLDGNAPAYDGFSEMWFDDEQSFMAAMGSPEGEAAAADVANFADVEQMLTFNIEEIEII